MKLVKKLTALLLVACMLLSLNINVLATDATPEEEPAANVDAEGLWQYALCETGVELTAYLGSATDVYAPSNIKVGDTEYAVLKLGEGIFKNNDAINSVTLGVGILEIGAEAFYDADNLVCIVTNEQLTTIGDKAFYSCDAFNSIILYDTVATIGAEAFAECPKLTIWCSENSAGHSYATANSVTYTLFGTQTSPIAYIENGITYHIQDGEAIAIAYDGSATEVTVPATVNGYPIVEVRGTFSGHASVTKINLSNGLKIIGAYTFQNTGITELVIPDSVTVIRQYGFMSAKSLTSLRIPSGVTTIEPSTFMYCSALQSISLPNTVTSIGATAFIHCSSLTDIVIPGSVKTIGDRAFQNCKKLEQATLMEGVTAIQNQAFYYCDSLQKIIIPSTVTTISALPQWTVLMVSENSYAHTYAINNGYYYFLYDGTNQPEIVTQDGVTYYVDGGVARAIRADFSMSSYTMPASISGYPVSIGKVFYNYTNLRTVVLSAGMTEIPDDAFCGCTALTTVTLPEGITRIGDGAFAYCEALTSITLPDDVVSIGEAAFYGCKKLSNMKLGSKLTEIAVNSFAECRALTSVVIPQGVLSIGANAFSYCTSLKSISIPDSVTTIGNGAFYSCVSLTSVTVPAGVAALSTELFYNCSALTQVEIQGNVTKIQDYAFYGCKKLTAISLPDTVTAIGARAFYNCQALLQITIPSRVTSIGSYAFAECVSLSKINSLGSISTIPTYAFLGCTSLQEVTLPDCITAIQANAFSNCTKLRMASLPQSVAQLTTTSFPAYTILVVQENSYAHTYAGNNGLVYFIYSGTVQPEVYVISGVSYVIVDGKAMAIDFDGSVTEVTIPAAVNGYPVMLYVAFQNQTQITKIVLSEGITQIDTGAFAGCTALQEIVIPNSVSTIQANAFSGCSALRSIDLPAGLTSIEAGTFEGCTALAQIEIPNTVSVIGNKAFKNCSSLSAFTIGDTITAIGNEAFNGCAALQSIFIPAGITSFGSYVFAGCSQLQTVMLPADIPKIYEGMFRNCSSLTSVSIPETVTEIGQYAFSGCTALNDITLTEEIHVLGNSAFALCSSLTSLVIPDSVYDMGEDVFSNCTSLVDITISDGIVQLSEGMFYRCLSLTEIYIPDSVKELGDEVFWQCTALTCVDMPDSITSIGQDAFNACTALKTVKLPNQITSLSAEIFYGCSSLSRLHIPASVTFIDYQAIPAHIMLLVERDSYAHQYAIDNVYLYFIVEQTENPEINYGAGVSGTVSYTDGTAAAGATVEILYDDGMVKESVAADESGAYAFTYAEVGQYTVRATDSQGFTVSTAVSVKRMNAFDVFVAGDADLTLKKAYGISGTVNVGNATVTVTDEDGNVVSSVVADAQGAFTVENIPNGTYIVTATSESGRVAQEVTVFDASVTGLTLTIASQTATIWGYVEVEDRDAKHHRRNWVEVTVYNEEGVAVAQCRSDKDGMYRFEGLPLGDYSIVAETAEMRSDKKHHYDRSHTLTGYAYVSAIETVTYQAETIVLYEENDNLATIAGKVTAQGQTQVCEVVLRNVFRHEVASYTTKNNGKYSFSNVRDGLYFITAVTESHGMGFTVVVVHNGKVYGETDITVCKSDKVKDREDRFKNEIPELGCREDALAYRERIAEEKRFYDGLSHKEKKQLSRDYIERLNRYAEWLANTQYTTDDGVTIEQGGLVVSGDELEKEEEISFTVHVEKTEGHTPSSDGVKNDKDFKHHSMRDAAEQHEIKQYYEITMTKTVDGKEKALTSVYKDTDAMGKFRITMEIPEEYRGHQHYSILHEHCGEVVSLTDLDDDPNTITFEVDKFSTFALAATDEFLTEEEQDELKFAGASLSLQHNLSVNYKVNAALFTDGGYSNPYVVFELNGVKTTVTDYTVSGDRYVFTFSNIAPNKMNDTIYATLYAEYDGELVASETRTYSIAEYCYSMLTLYSGDTYAELRTLLVDLLHYGAASQTYTKYRTDALVNSALTETQLAWGTAEDPVLESVFNSRYETVENPAATWKGVNLLLDDSISMKIKFKAESIDGLSLKVVMANNIWTFTSDQFIQDGDAYYVVFSELNAGQMSETIYLSVCEGETVVSNTASYSVESYAYEMQNSTVENLAPLVKSMMKYGNAAYAYLH